MVPPPPRFGGGSALVVDVKVADAVPTVSVVTFAVLYAKAVVCRIHTVSPLLIVPSLDVKVTSAPHPTEYFPPLMLIVAGPSMPEMVTVLDVTDLFGFTPV
jgi:hypothetical protein